MLQYYFVYNHKQGLLEGYKLLTPALDYERCQSSRKKKNVGE